MIPCFEEIQALFDIFIFVEIQKHYIGSILLDCFLDEDEEGLEDEEDEDDDEDLEDEDVGLDAVYKEHLEVRSVIL